VIAPQECRRRGIDVAAAADGSELRVVARGNLSEKGVPPHFRDDGRGGDSDVVLFAEIERPQMGVALSQQPEDFLAIGNDPFDGDGSVDDVRGRDALELVEKPMVAIAVHLLVVAYLHLNVFRKAADMLRELGTPRTRFLPRPELLRVHDPTPGQRRSGLRLENNTRHYHRSENRSSPCLVDAENHDPMLSHQGHRLQR